jgi:Na+-transporting methylmalonyl-CoA/oxaloacetate decarboxylase gamma subunit
MDAKKQVDFNKTINELEKYSIIVAKVVGVILLIFMAFTSFIVSLSLWAYYFPAQINFVYFLLTIFKVLYIYLVLLIILFAAIKIGKTIRKDLKEAKERNKKEILKELLQEIINRRAKVKHGRRTNKH